MKESEHQIDMIQVVNALQNQHNNPFFIPNWSFKTLLALVPPQNLNMLFSCMLLEKKLILVAADSQF